MSWRGIIAGLILAFAGTTAGADTLDTGRTAYMQGEYARAFEILKPLAEKGDATAAYIIGRQYQLGQGTARDLGEAWYWYRRAEAKGNVEAALFRHLLVSKWKISAADRARGEAKYAAFKHPARAAVARAPVARAPAARAPVARITMRPSPKPTLAVAPPPTDPKTETVSQLPRVRIAPIPQPSTKKDTEPEVATNPPAKQPVTARRPETCAGCGTNNDDTDPYLPDREPQTARRPQVFRGNDWNERNGSEPAIAPSPQVPTWRETPAYNAPPPAVRYRAPGYWRYRAWNRPNWRAWARWRRFGPGRFVRRRGFRRWGRY